MDTVSTNSQCGSSRPRAGVARRATQFSDLVQLADSFAGMEAVSSAAVTGLVLRAVRIADPALSLSAAYLLALLVEHVYRSDRWRTGNLRVTASNARLANMLGVSARTVRELLARLEERHWIVRRYNNGNQRGDMAGIDLRPLAARLVELQQAEARTGERAAERKAMLRDERVDEDAESNGDCRRNSSSGEEADFHLKPYKQNPGLSDLVQAQPDGNVPQSPQAPDDRAHATAQRELISLMAEASPTLQRQLRPHELGELLQGEASPQTLLTVSRAVVWLLRRSVRLRAAVWEPAVKKHGWAALAAVLVAVDRQGVRDPAAYLSVMLRSTQLHETVYHNLRALAYQSTGRA